LKRWRDDLKSRNASLVFTNGVFDILHAGHVSYLIDARNAGDALIIGLNSDSSVRSIKGPKRPLQPEDDRAQLLASLRSTDAVAIFDEDTPLEIVSFLVPDIMIKGADYSRETIVGADIVEQNGGKVLTIPLSKGRSTTNIVEEVLKRYR
jgi:rfaE bifunctional protein nucleotidyltransferase chain/domain